MGVPRLKQNQDLITLRFPFPAQGKRATGLITCTTNANMADTDFMTIGDGVNPAVVYEYDKTGNGVTAGRVAWAVGAGTAAQGAATLKTAIEANQPLIAVTDNADGTLSLESKLPGSFANVTITENVANAAHTVAGMTGGLDADRIQADITIPYWEAAGDFEVVSAQIYTRDALLDSASSFVVVTLQNDTTVLATWSTETGEEEDLAAATLADMTLSDDVDDLRGEAGDVLSLKFDVTLTPKVPEGFVEVHVRYRGKMAV